MPPTIYFQIIPWIIRYWKNINIQLLWQSHFKISPRANGLLFVLSIKIWANISCRKSFGCLFNWTYNIRWVVMRINRIYISKYWLKDSISSGTMNRMERTYFRRKPNTYRNFSYVPNNKKPISMKKWRNNQTKTKKYQNLYNISFFSSDSTELKHNCKHRINHHPTMAKDIVRLIYRWRMLIIVIISIAIHTPAVCGKSLTSSPLSLINSSSHLSGFGDIKSK